MIPPRVSKMDSNSDLSDAPQSTTDEPNPQDEMVKKLVRLALASEHSRIPLRRADITSKGNSYSSHLQKKVR